MATINTINTATDTPASAATITNDNFTSLETDVDLNTAKVSYTDAAAVALNTAKVSADGSIDTHSDVDITSAANNDYLQFNSSTEKWENTSLLNSRQFEVQAYQASNTNPYPANIGDFPIAQVSSSQDIYFSFSVPSDFVSLTSVEVVFIPDATETIQIDYHTNFGLSGEAYDINDLQSLNETLSVTLGQITVWDITSLTTDIFSGLSADHHVGLRLSSDTSNIQPLKIIVKYTT